MHRTTMDSLAILFLIGAGLHLTSSAETADHTSGGRYTKPIVYSNLPPPVLYFPNFPERQKISERGDADEKRVEYMPFPFKDLPLLVYQSDNQPPVHVVQQQQQQQAISGSDAAANQPSSPQPPGNDGKSTQQSGSAVYMQSNGQHYQNIQMVPVEQDNSNPITYSTAQDTFPDLQNHQFISIGLSAIHDYLGNTVFPADQPPANSASQSQQVPDSQSYGMQNSNQYPQQQGKNVANQVPPPQTQQYFVRQNAGQQNSQAPMQYSVQSSQQSANSYQNPNAKVSPQTQQNMISQYVQGTPMQYQSQMQSLMQSSAPQMQQEQGYSNQNQAQIQYVQNNQQQNVAYRQNSPQSSYNAMQQAFYQQAGDTNTNGNSIQHLGISISSVQPPSPSNQQQVVGNKAMGQNVYQQNRQNQQSQPVPQMESSAENDSGEDDPQFIRIAVYPYGAIDPNQVQEPDQFYKIAIPQTNDEDEDDEEYEENTNSMGVNSGKTQHVTNQVQGSRYRGSSSAVGQNSKQQRPFYANSYQQRLPSKMNTANMNKQQRNKEQTQKQTQQNSPENQIPEETEYQQILIHIPHSIAAAPQILIQPDGNDQPSASYMGTVQGQELRKPSSTNKKRQPQFASSNNGYQVTDYIHPATGSISFNQRYTRPKAFPRFPPINFVSAASSNYPRNLFRIPFGNNVGRYASKPLLPIGSAHPEVYASSNQYFTSVNPLFLPNPMRNLYRIPFNQVSASMMRPQILPNPLMPLDMFHSSYPDELMAQASFPRITRSRKDDLNSTEGDINGNGFLNSESSSESDRIIKSLAAKSTEAFLKQIASDVQAHDILDGVLGTSNAKNPGVAAFNVPQLPDFLKFNYAGQIPNAPFLPTPHQSISIPQSQGGGKYGSFMKKLAALSNSLVYQSLGMKPPVPFRDVTKVKHHSNEFNIEEIIDSVLPENASPRATILKTDRIGASLPQKEFSKRVLNTEDKIANPPIIVYKGLKPPVEVYGNKDDIEAVDPLEASASEMKATSRVADDIAETNPENVFDYVDIMYSMLPDFIKHSIGQLNDDQLGSEWLPVDATSAPKIIPKEEASSNESKIPTDVKSAISGKESSSAFKEDIEELSKLLHKEEKSDLMPF